MERRSRVRITTLIILIAMMFSLFGFRIYKLQTALTEEEKEQQDSITYQTTVSAARGPILDRNGTVLVTNRASYNLIIINFVWQNGPHPNESLQELIHTLDELGIELVHHLPITETRPYQYTLDEMDEIWAGYFRKFLTARSMDSDISAATFMESLRKAYKLPEDLPQKEIYKLIAIRYELELRGIKGMPLDNYVLAEDVDASQLAAIIELDIPGVIVDISTVRQYNTKDASHLLGTTRKMSAEEYQDIYKDQGYLLNAVVGADGVERAFEQYLHGQDGILRTTITADGEILDQEYLSTPEPGSAVELTIDIDLQETAYKSLESYILNIRANGANEKMNGMDAEGGAVVVQDVKTGEVLAAASYPGYDPELFNKNYNELLNDPYKPLINRCLNAQYPPGSVYKMVTAITAMEYEGISRWFEVVDEGSYTKYRDQGYTPACHIFRSRGVTHGVENMMDAIRDSCNYYFYEVGLQCSTSDMDYVASQLGLGEPTGVELSEYAGQRANPETKAKVFAGTQNAAWVDGDKLQHAIGQSVNEITPMQLSVYVSALANQGVRMKATFLRRVVSWDFQELLKESKPEVVADLGLSEETLTMLREGMVAAAGLGATADPFATEHYPIQVAAKTGTAQHGNGLSSDNASLVCYAPADDPQIAIAIYVENGAVGGKLSYIAMDIMDNYFSQTGKYETVYGENEIR